jgi:hypothetical protein
MQPKPSIIRLGVLLLLFDVYLTWARIEKAAGPDADTAAEEDGSNLSAMAEQPIVFQYLFFCEFARFTNRARLAPRTRRYRQL